MNSIIEEQLRKCKVADLSRYDAGSRTYDIPRYNQVRMVEGKSYVIRLDASLLKPNPGDAFHVNWNKGRLPISEAMLVEVGNVNGKAVYVYGIGYDLQADAPTQKAWDGWLPIERLAIIRSL